MCIQESDNLVETSYKLIRNMILSYKLAPGSIISDYVLSKELNISRTPIRQAILLLISNGLVEKKENSFYVVKINGDFLDSLYKARICLEPFMLQQTEEIDLAIGTKLINEEIEAIQKKDYLKALDKDLAFHKFLVSSYNNPILNSAYESVYSRMKLVNILSIASVNKKAPEEYQNIIEELKNNNKAKASKLLLKSIEKGYKQKIKIIEKHGDNIASIISAYCNMEN